MVINLKSKIEEAKKEFDDENYEKALEILDAGNFGEEYSKLVLILKIGCLRGLKQFDEALAVINSAIEKFPYEDFFWARKVECHYFNDENDAAIKALDELERIMDRDDRDAILLVSNISHLIGENERALKYCDMALAIDENWIEAVDQKAMIASSLRDYDMMSDCADRLLELYDEDIMKVMIPLMLKIFSKRYDDALSIIKGVDVLDDEHDLLLKSALFNAMSEDLRVKIGTSSPVEITMDDALGILMDYHYGGEQLGKVCGVDYMVLKSR